MKTLSIFSAQKISQHSRSICQNVCGPEVH
ncbi:hypothetical protein CBM2599_A10309 [Cupriavidus taiwanensis]|nr:hypothetical protein CBM2599_A10309 [Cupriavidus taiwanensis]SOY80498.1 hypothetical protein CBM2600_A10155 [Cupriavidus taiwanensis]